jgi:hypothetical protein
MFWRRRRRRARSQSEAPRSRTQPAQRPDPPVDRDHVRDWFDRILDPATRSHARDVAAALVRSTPNRRLRGLDHQMRERSPWLAPTGARLRATEVDAFAGQGADRWSILGLCAMHRDGYVREEALRHLGAGPPAMVAPFVLLRIDDWVDPVRDRAAQQTAALIDSAEPHALLLALPVIWNRLMVPGQEGRALPVIESLRTFLSEPATRPCLDQAIQTTSDPWVARIALQVLLKIEDAEALHHRVGNTTDLAIAVKVARACLSAEPSAGTVDDLLASRFAAVRSLAVFWALEHQPSAALEDQVLIDGSRSVREQGQRHLARDGRDARTWYLARLTADPDDIASLVGLGDVATGDDASLGAIEAESPDPTRRLAAVDVLGHSASEGSTRRLVDLVGDPVPRVSRAAANALRGRSIPTAEIDRLIELADGSEVRARNVRRAVSELPRWQRLIAALRLCALSAPAGDEGRALLEVVLKNWQRSSTRPTDLERARARALATSLQATLGPLGAQLQQELSWED